MGPKRHVPIDSEARTVVAPIFRTSKSWTGGRRYYRPLVNHRGDDRRVLATVTVGRRDDGHVASEFENRAETASLPVLQLKSKHPKHGRTFVSAAHAK